MQVFGGILGRFPVCLDLVTCFNGFINGSQGVEGWVFIAHFPRHACLHKEFKGTYASQFGLGLFTSAEACQCSGGSPVCRDGTGDTADGLGAL